MRVYVCVSLCVCVEDETGRQLCGERQAGGTDGLAEHGERPEPPHPLTDFH